MTPSDQALAQVGKPIEWVQTAPIKKEAKGICVGVRSSGSVLETEEGAFRGVQYAIQTDAGKVVWTCTFADEGSPCDGP